MKNFFGNRKNITAVSTICVVLLTMIAVTHYYLQYETGAIRWTLTFGYLFLLVQSVFVLGYGCANKKCGVKTVGIEFALLAVIMLVYCIIDLIPLRIALYIKPAGLILPLVLIPAYADSALTEKPLVKNVLYMVIASVVAIAAVVLSDLAIDVLDAGSKAGYVIGALFCIFGVVLAIVNLAKKKDELFAWSLIAYSFLGGLMFVLNLFDKTTLADKFLSLQNLGASVMLIAVVMAQQVPVAVKRKRR
ncbi:MAG: hypothetical protein J6A69_12900 [Clostridia bacterium]|nr:hypothetical protein [Clostridia bacterium]